MKRTHLIAVLAVCLFVSAASVIAQGRHRILRKQNAFELEVIATGEKRPFDMWITRMANSLFDTRYTDQVISNLDDYQRYGINTVLVSVHGGNLGGPAYPDVYNTDGTLDLGSIVWTNLTRLLEETDRRGMVLQVQYWYFLRVSEVPLDADAIKATANVTKWLKDSGYEHYLLDIVNEFAHPAHTRPLFNSLPGALQLIQAVRTEDANVIVGISPPSRAFFPSGTLGTQTIEADYIIGHNRVLDPMNRGAYWFNSAPAVPTDYPYVNNEFWEQIAYERTRRLDPRTNTMSYGHFSPALVTDYLDGLTSLRAYNGYGAIHTRYQQHVKPGGTLPVSFVGPEGTQPEATSGAGEPSVHWLYHAIAGMQKRGPIPLKLDFAEWASGLEPIAGTWAVNGERYEQTDDTAAPAWSRVAIDGVDLELAFDLGFLATPGATESAGIMIGAPTPAGPSYRLSIYADRIELDQVGATFALETRALVKSPENQYRVRLSQGRIQVLVDGVMRIDVADPAPLTGRNLLLFTSSTTAWFDNVRSTPVEITDFEDQTTGRWQPEIAAEWSLETVGMNTAWKAITPTNANSRAILDLNLGDFSLDATVDLSDAPSVSVYFRCATLAAPMDGYALSVSATGLVGIDRLDQSAPPLTLGSATATIADPQNVHLRLIAEGNTFVLLVDGAPALQVSDAGTSMPRGLIALVTEPGTTRFDDVELRVCPSRLPIARFLPFTGTPLPLGFSLEIGDPDGLRDLTGLQLLLDQGTNAFTDITFVLIPQFGVFTPTIGADGTSVTFSLNAAVPIGSNGWTLRLVGIDRDGNVRTTDLTL